MNDGDMATFTDSTDAFGRTGLQRHIQRLMQEKGILETVVNTLHEGVVVIGRNLRISYANHAARRLLGLKENDVGQRINRFLRTVEWSRFLTSETRESATARRQVEIFYPEHRFLSFYIVSLGEPKEKDGSAPLAAIILQDITESVKHVEETVESEKIQTLTLLAAGVAHELGNPLNSLNIHLQLLGRIFKRTDDQELVAEAGELLEVARLEVSRLDSIVSNFLRAVRATPLQMTPLLPATLLAEVLEFLRLEIADRDIDIRFSPDADLPLVLADSGQLKQAFFNLVKNAIQAMPNGGALDISCVMEPDWMVIRFADSGMGIPATELPHILDPYYTTKESGTGLGLLIVERIVRSHGGELAIDSTEGHGATFTIRLPCHDRRPRLLENPQDTSDEE